jgi:hypothetical protein
VRTNYRSNISRQGKRSNAGHDADESHQDVPRYVWRVLMGQILSDARQKVPCQSVPTHRARSVGVSLVAAMGRQKRDHPVHG